MAQQHRFVCDQGATFSQVITYKNASNQPINLTGYTARMQVRESVESPIVLLNLSTENDGIAIDGAGGTLTLNGPAAERHLCRPASTFTTWS